jgi:hypothetical protein
MNIEEALRDIRAKSALLRYVGSSGAVNPEPPTSDALAGMAILCEDIELHARSLTRALPVTTLAVEIKRTR